MALPFFADSFPPTVFSRLGPIGWVPTLELTVHVRRRPAAGWLACQVWTDDLHNGKLIESCRIWDSTRRSGGAGTPARTLDLSPHRHRGRYWPMDPAVRFPSVAHLQEHAHKRIPHFAWEYLDSGEMAEAARNNNIDALQQITLTPALHEGTDSSRREHRALRTRLQRTDLASLRSGLTTGLIWPGADHALAQVRGQCEHPLRGVNGKHRSCGRDRGRSLTVTAGSSCTRPATQPSAMTSFNGWPMPVSRRLS